MVCTDPFKKWLGFFLSLVIVAFGQPAKLPSLAIFASGMGFGLFFASARYAFPLAFSWFFLVQLIQLSWMSSIHYQGVFFLLVYIGISAGLALQFSWFASLVKNKDKLSFFSVASLGAIWTLLEWVRSFFLCGFMFNQVGITLSASIYTLQMASLFGVFGLSFYVMSMNLVFFKAWKEKNKSTWGVWAVLFIMPWLFGALHLELHKEQENRAPTREVLLMQPGLTPSEKERLPGREGDFIPAITQWERVIEELLRWKEKNIDLVVFPEGAFPHGLSRVVCTKREADEVLSPLQLKGELLQEEDPVSNYYLIKCVAKALQAEVIVGLDSRRDGKNYNSAFWFSSKGELKGRYDKHILLPIAEYTPFASARWISSLYGIDSFFSRGQNRPLWGREGYSPSICYEELFPMFIQKGVQRKKATLVNLSNDGWYPNSNLAKEHMAHALLRAVENGMPLIRCCNTGISGVISSLGKVVSAVAHEKKDSLVVCFPRYYYTTLFSIVGHTPLIVFCMVIGGIFLLQREKPLFIFFSKRYLS